MSYLKLSDLSGSPLMNSKGFTAGVPHITVSKFGSKKSNGPQQNRSANWWKRYQDKNDLRANGRVSRRG